MLNALTEGGNEFVEKLVTHSGLRLSTLSDTLNEYRHGLSGYAAKVSPDLESILSRMERYNWDKGVNAYAVGLAKALFDNAERGHWPAIFGRMNRMTKADWTKLTEPEKFQVIGQAVQMITGQLPRTMFKTDQRWLSRILFSKSWQQSNLGAALAAVNSKGSYAMRGLGPEQQKIMRTLMQSYLTRTSAQHLLFSDLMQKAVTLGLLGTAIGIYQNPPGYRTRVWTGKDEKTGKNYFTLNPIGFMWKEVENVYDVGSLAAQGKLAEAGHQAARTAINKLAFAPRLLAETGHFALQRLPKGRDLTQDIMDSVESVTNDFLPISTFAQQGTPRGLAAGAGIFSRQLLPSAKQGRIGMSEVHRLIGAAKQAKTQGNEALAKTLMGQAERAFKEWQDQVNQVKSFEELTKR